MLFRSGCHQTPFLGFFYNLIVSSTSFRPDPGPRRCSYFQVLNCYNFSTLRKVSVIFIKQAPIFAERFQVDLAQSNLSEGRAVHRTKMKLYSQKRFLFAYFSSALSKPRLFPCIVMEWMHSDDQQIHNWMGNCYRFLYLSLKKYRKGRKGVFTSLNEAKMRHNKECFGVSIKRTCVETSIFMVGLDKCISSLYQEREVPLRKTWRPGSSRCVSPSFSAAGASLRTFTSKESSSWCLLIILPNTV